MVIMTFNIQSGTNYPDIDRINVKYCAAVIKKYNPDIVGLNEVHDGGKWGYQTRELAELLGYPYYYFAKAIEAGSPYGNAILSKYPIKKAETVMIPDPLVKDEDAYYETRCILNAIIDCEKELNVLVTHMGLANSEKENAVKTIFSIVGKSPVRTVLLGDFNMHPENSLMDKLQEILCDSANYDKEKYFTFPSDNPKEKIDYIFTSRDLCVENVFVPIEIGSDHRAYVCEIRF